MKEIRSTVIMKISKKLNIEDLSLIAKILLQKDNDLVETIKALMEIKRNDGR
jgi:hypothetical protein